MNTIIFKTKIIKLLIVKTSVINYDEMIFKVVLEYIEIILFTGLYNIIKTNDTSEVGKLKVSHEIPRSWCLDS